MFLASNEIIKIYVEPFLKFYTARSEPYVIRTIYWKRQRLNVNQPRRYSSDIFIIQWHTGVQRNAVWPNRKWRWLVLRVHAVSAFQLVPLSWHQMRNRMSSQAGAARQCVRHARYRQYPPIRFSSLFRSPGDRTPAPHYRLHCFTILPRLQHNRVFITTSTQPRAPLSSLFFFPFIFPFLWRTMRPSMKSPWDCIGILYADCHRVCSPNFFVSLFLSLLCYFCF